jgi:hypothetical protein
VALAAVALVAAGAGFKTHEITDVVSFWFHQHRCSAYRAPSDQIVFDESSTSQPPTTQGTGGGGGILLPMPSSWSALRTWHGYGDPGCVNLFLHERVSPGGIRRVIAIDLKIGRLSNVGSKVTLENHLWEPRWLPGPAGNATGADYLRKRTGWSDFWIKRRGPADRLRFYAGQPDPNDSSRFLLPFDWRGQRVVLDGRLGEDGRIDYTLRPLADGLYEQPPH